MKKQVLVTREVFDETIEFLARSFDVTSNQAKVDFNREWWSRLRQWHFPTISA